ncbi:MAG: hypothetical protein QXS20_08025 [Candidatus Thorarchaeota archaeon]
MTRGRVLHMKPVSQLQALVIILVVAMFHSQPVVIAETWTDNGEVSFLAKINGVPITASNVSNPIEIDPTVDLVIGLTLNASYDIILRTFSISMSYAGLQLLSIPVDLGSVPVPAGTSVPFSNTTLPVGPMLSPGGVTLVTGTIHGEISITYSLITAPSDNRTLAESFVIRVGHSGIGALVSVAGMATLAFTAISVFGLLLSLDDFQQGILAARKVRRGKTPAGVGIFPPSIILRRRAQKGSEKIDVNELVQKVRQVARNHWDGKRCPRCNKGWKQDMETCRKCGLAKSDAMSYFAEGISEYAPRALKAVPPRSKVTVGKFSRRLKLKRDKGGALAAVLTEMGIFQTKNVKVPLRKVSMSGLTLAGTYWSWMQILGSAVPTWSDYLILAALGLVVSVIVGYLMNWLARIPPMGYDS